MFFLCHGSNRCIVVSRLYEKLSVWLSGFVTMDYLPWGLHQFAWWVDSSQVYSREKAIRQTKWSAKVMRSCGDDGWRGTQIISTHESRERRMLVYFIHHQRRLAWAPWQEMHSRWGPICRVRLTSEHSPRGGGARWRRGLEVKALRMKKKWNGEGT